MLRGGFKAIHGDLLHIRFREKIVEVLTFLFTGRKKTVFLYTFADKNKNMRKESKYEFFGCFQNGESVRQSGVNVEQIPIPPSSSA